jgi:hypothetical protein
MDGIENNIKPDHFPIVVHGEVILIDRDFFPVQPANPTVFADNDKEWHKFLPVKLLKNLISAINRNFIFSGISSANNGNIQHKGCGFEPDKFMTKLLIHFCHSDKIHVGL